MAESDDPDYLPTQSWAGTGELSTVPESDLPTPPRSSSRRRGGWEPPSPEELQPSFPQFEIASVLGRGGMGAVYKGWQKRLGRFVAIKILRPDLEDEAGNFAKRFEREAKAMARLSHPGIVSVFDAGEAGGLVYFVMEYVEGADVEKLVAAQGRLSPEQAWTITSRVCQALAYAHENGVIHRDIKPSNVMVDAKGRVKVADFGLAKVAADATALLTVSNMRMGTPDFMAPEAIMGGAVDHRADLYAVGVMLHRMLTGELPRGRFELPSHRVSGLDIRFDTIIDHALQSDPRKRYSSATDILTDLERIFADPLREASTAPPSPPSTPAPFVDPAAGLTPARSAKPATTINLPLNMKLALASWTPSLRDLLRIRHKLKPAEVWRLGEKLAAILDKEHSTGASRGALLIHGITIIFRDSLSERDARAKLRESVAEWPPFDLFIAASNHLAEGETVLLNGLETIITAGDLAGDRVQRLARVLYEMLGGAAGTQFTPLGCVGEKGSAVLGRGLAEGTKAFPQAGNFLDELRAAAADEPAHHPASRRIPMVHRPMDGSGSGQKRKVSAARLVAECRGRFHAKLDSSRKVFGAAVLGAIGLTSFAAFGWNNLLSLGKAPVQVVATREAPFVNSLGMEFVPAGKIGAPADGKRVLFSVWDTRVQDYAVYARESWLMKWFPSENPLFEQGPRHPVVMVSCKDARSFCGWLTDRERASGRIGRHDQYRLPSDYEWSCAVGIGTLEKAEDLADAKGEAGAIYPWGKQWPPPKGAGDYAGQEVLRKAEAGGLQSHRDVLPGFDDGFVHTSPVGSFAANRFGLYDMGGNVWQWCEDGFDERDKRRTPVLRGASWRNCDPLLLRSTYRDLANPGDRRDDSGFRCVLVVSGG